MQEEFSRAALLFGEKRMERLAAARVAVFGLGGVGGSAAEALARSGIGAIDLIDSDRVSRSNINRQVIALQSTVGEYKTDAASARLKDINPSLEITARRVFFMPDNAAEFDFPRYDYVVDAIDTVTAKLEIITRCAAAGTPVISCMGTGNKLDPSRLEVDDIYNTSVCPLARVMRYELKKRGVKRLKVVYSKEQPLGYAADAPTEFTGKDEPSGKRVPASTAFVPPAAGLLLASEVIKDLLKGLP